MTDRELLELAAKATGMYVKGTYVNAHDEFIGLKVKQSKAAQRYQTKSWNPLIDDGDALRLAVKLRITFRHIGHKVAAVSVVQCDEYCNGDENATARRAIVRAAAEMGKVMV